MVTALCRKEFFRWIKYAALKSQSLKQCNVNVNVDSQRKEFGSVISISLCSCESRKITTTGLFLKAVEVSENSPGCSHFCLNWKIIQVHKT